MKLIMSPASPFVRKVRVILREGELTGLVAEHPVFTTPLATPQEVRAANPTGKIPVLVREDGPAIHDSRVITRFLDDRFELGLYPKSRLWEVLTLEAMADGIMDAAVLMVYEHRFRPEPLWFADWTEAQWGKVTGGLDAIENRWMSHLAGPLNATQIAVGCALSYLDLRHPGRAWRDGRPALADWHAAFAARPSMVETAPD